MLAHHEAADERGRLTGAPSSELLRTRILLERVFARRPARIAETGRFTAAQGNAVDLDEADSSYHAALLLGPPYQPAVACASPHLLALARRPAGS